MACLAVIGQSGHLGGQRCAGNRRRRGGEIAEVCAPSREGGVRPQRRKSEIDIARRRGDLLHMRLNRRIALGGRGQTSKLVHVASQDNHHRPPMAIALGECIGGGQGTERADEQANDDQDESFQNDFPVPLADCTQACESQLYGRHFASVSRMR